MAVARGPGVEGTQALVSGLAAQIVFGGCDHDTASFYSDASGTATVDANPDPQRGNFRQRPLLTVDEVVTPQMGNCTIFARYVEPAFATQVIFTARLTRLYEREDWAARFAAVSQDEPLQLERGVTMPGRVRMPDPLNQRRITDRAAFERAALRAMKLAELKNLASKRVQNDPEQE